MRGKLTRGAEIDLGLAISSATLEPGERRTHRDIAAFCSCTWQNIFNIEKRALKKVRLALYRDKQLGSELKASLEKAFRKI